jgi:hypothetical protein
MIGNGIPCHLDCMSVPQLVRREPAPQARQGREPPGLAAGGGR